MKANIEARFRIIFLIFISKCINVISKLPLMNSSWVKMDIFPTDLTSVSEEYLCNSCYNHDCCLLSWKNHFCCTNVRKRLFGIAKIVARFHKTCISTQRQQFSTSDAQCQILHLIIPEEIYLDFFCNSTISY